MSDTVMDKKLLRKFLKTNEPTGDVPSAPAIAHFSIFLDSTPEGCEKMMEAMDSAVYELQPERKELVMLERGQILESKNADDILQFMRKHTDPMNQHILIGKACEFENELLPTIVKMLKTSLNDGFIETSIRVLAKCEKNVADELMECFDEIRNPYAKSMVLVMLGFRAPKTAVPWVLEQYYALKKTYADANFYDGAYHSLLELNSRFFS